jgi:galactonate dehydratase
VKFDPLYPGHQDLSQARLVADTVEIVAELRATVGPDVDLVLELGRKLTPGQAIPLVEALEPFGALWIEDPLQIDSIASQADVAARVAALIALGERLHTGWEFRELLTYGVPVVCRPDLGLAGGFTQCRKIAALAETFHTSVSPHNFLGPLLTTASIHLDAAIPNLVVQEYFTVDEQPEIASVFKSDYARIGGYIPLVDTPGLGVELTPGDHPRLTPIDYPLTVPERADGSVASAV